MQFILVYINKSEPVRLFHKSTQFVEYFPHDYRYINKLKLIVQWLACFKLTGVCWIFLIMNRNYFVLNSFWFTSPLTSYQGHSNIPRQSLPCFHCDSEATSWKQWKRLVLKLTTGVLFINAEVDFYQYFEQTFPDSSEYVDASIFSWGKAWINSPIRWRLEIIREVLENVKHIDSATSWFCCYIPQNAGKIGCFQR